MTRGPETLLMSGYGINCERETAWAFKKAGADPRIIHINDLIADKRILDTAKILVWPGGFSMGDDTGAGKGYAAYVLDNIRDELERFKERDTLSLGICNGFQIMTQLGFFPIMQDRHLGISPDRYFDKDTPQTALVHNDNARYTVRWVYLRNEDDMDNCVWTSVNPIHRLFLPIAHGEGKFYAPDDVMGRLWDNGQVVFGYCSEDGHQANGGPANPNGSVDDVAAICDPSGRFMGMMPHPERAVLDVESPDYFRMREEAKRSGEEWAKDPTAHPPRMTECMQLFRNAVGYFQ